MASRKSLRARRLHHRPGNHLLRGWPATLFPTRPHLPVFMIFGFASLLIVQLGGIFLLSANRHLTQKQLQQMIESKPQFLVGTNVLWYALLFLFLYMTLAVLRGLPFWRSLGWKRLNPDPDR